VSSAETKINYIGVIRAAFKECRAMDIIEKSWEVQDGIEDKVKNVGKGKYGRVLKMARKPTSDEFNRTVIITGIGIVLIGLLGFAIYLIWKTVVP
jgi:protein transport protein SEC61 subunit gamma-like protein